MCKTGGLGFFFCLFCFFFFLFLKNFSKKIEQPPLCKSKSQSPHLSTLHLFQIKQLKKKKTTKKPNNTKHKSHNGPNTVTQSIIHHVQFIVQLVLTFYTEPMLPGTQYKNKGLVATVLGRWNVWGEKLYVTRRSASYQHSCGIYACLYCLISSQQLLIQ